MHYLNVGTLRCMWKNVLLLLILTALIEIGFVATYHYQATGPLAPAIAEHTATLARGTIPPASDINIHNDPWVKVAHFESSYYQTRFIVDMLMSLIIAGVLVFAGISSALATRARALSPNTHLSRALYLAMLTGVLTIINIPLAFSGFVTEALRGTSFVTADSAVFTFVMDFFMGIFFTLIMFIPLYWIMDRYKHAWWAMGAVFMTLYTIVTVFVSPVLIDPLYYDQQPLEDPLVMAALSDVVSEAGIPTDRIFVTSASQSTYESNAYVTGLWSTKRILLTDTLLTFFTPAEIRAVVAHELGHYVYNHLWYDIALATVLTFLTFFVAAQVFRYLTHHYGSRLGARDVSNIVLFPVISTLFFVIPTITAPISSYTSRAFEHQADMHEARVARDIDSSINSHVKMAYQSFVDVDPPKVLQFWFGTHPTTLERIQYFESQR